VKPIAELRSVMIVPRPWLPTRITHCYPTEVNASRLNLSQTDLPTSEGWKAELTLVLVIYLDGSPIRRQSSILIVPLNRERLATVSRTRDLLIVSPTS